MFFLAKLLMVINQQNEIRINLGAIRKYVAAVRSRLQLGRRDFNVCLVGDKAIAELNGAHRGMAHPTDVLSFRWESGNKKQREREAATRTRELERREFSYFLGDVVISVETARRNAREAGHSVAREIRWLILHGSLHLLGYDHETDGGMMTELEHKLRAQLKT
jgi:probable rRNA maturation factor